MTPRITRLEGPIVDQIAAGEVVERPASVVKELVENAVDAGATTLTIDIENGGRERIRVADDGLGMSREDATLCIERHATSKLRTSDDLAAIRTLGFRGEALPSIASVSMMTVTTRTEEDDAGTEVEVRGGELVHIRDAGAARGTVVDVRNLFFNVPARLKFLKSKPTESGVVYDVALRVALAHPELRLVVNHDGRRVHAYLPARDFAERAALVFPEEGLVRVEARHETLGVRAMLGSPERARSGAKWLHVFVNGRPVYDAKLARAVSFAYGSVLPPGRYPSGVVHLDVPFDEVDVNAHPQKSEVRFARGASFYESVTRALARELGTRAFGGPVARDAGYWDVRLGGRIATERSTDTPSSPRASGSTDFMHALGGEPVRDARPPSVNLPYAVPRDASDSARERADSAHTTPMPPSPTSGAISSAQSMLATQAAAPQRRVPTDGDVHQALSRELAGSLPDTSTPMAPRGTFGGLRFLGQSRRMFLVCEGALGLQILDQHAVDERILYHRMRASYAARSVALQRLLFPERVELHASEVDFVDKQAEALASAGLEVTCIGPTTVAVHAVPALLARAKPATLLRDLIAELMLEGDRAFGDAIDTAIATMACHAAIRAGDELSPAECQALLIALNQVDAFAGHCPHGRPVVTTIPFDELEKKLGR